MRRFSAQDHVTGETTYVTEGIGGVFGEGILRFDAVDVQLAHSLKRELTIRDDDPLSARYVLTQSYEMGREGWRTRIDTRTQMHSDRATSTSRAPSPRGWTPSSSPSGNGMSRFPRSHVSSRRALGFLR